MGKSLLLIAEVVLKLVDFDKSLLEMKNSKDQTALHVLANMPHVFESGLSMQFWERFIYNRNNPPFCPL